MYEHLPPKSTNRHRPPANEELVALADKCRRNSGMWFEYPRQFDSSGGASNVQSRIRRGVLAAFRPVGTFDAKVRQGVLYVRHVPEPDNRPCHACGMARGSGCAICRPDYHLGG